LDRYFAAGEELQCRRVGGYRRARMRSPRRSPTGEIERRRAVFGDSEWATEMCADWHTLRWFFEREIRRHHEKRRLGHHGALPGDIVETRGLGRKADRHFYLRRLGRGARAVQTP
jgi:hypothetical protein